jgi:hypothetical protein
MSNDDGAYTAFKNAQFEALHPRHKSGTSQGGEFAPKGATGAVTVEQRSIIRRFDSDLWNKGEGRPSQGEMRILRDAGLATEDNYHAFALTEAGQAVLKEERFKRGATQAERLKLKGR